MPEISEASKKLFEEIIKKGRLIDGKGFDELNDQLKPDEVLIAVTKCKFEGKMWYGFHYLENSETVSTYRMQYIGTSNICSHHTYYAIPKALTDKVDEHLRLQNET